MSGLWYNNTMEIDQNSEMERLIMRHATVTRNLANASPTVKNYIQLQREHFGFHADAFLDMAETLTWMYGEIVGGRWPATSGSAYMGYVNSAVAREIGRDLS